MSVYKTLDEILFPEKLKKDLPQGDEFFTPEDKAIISDYVDEQLMKELGKEKYQKLEDYLMANKDNEDLQQIMPDLMLKVMFNNMMYFSDEELNIHEDFMSKPKEEILEIDKKFSYKITVKLQEYLEKFEYDTERILKDIYAMRPKSSI